MTTINELTTDLEQLSIYALVDNKTGKVLRGGSKNKAGLFLNKSIAEKHAWRYTRNSNYSIVEYKADI